MLPGGEFVCDEVDEIAVWFDSGDIETVKREFCQHLDVGNGIVQREDDCTAVGVGEILSRCVPPSIPTSETRDRNLIVV